jgi:cytoskeletal protein CcmA (bactofilin family)
MGKSSASLSALLPPQAAEPIETKTSVISEGLIVSGEIIGSQDLIIEGRAEGIICLPNRRVTIERNGRATADITAGEILVVGKVIGNLNASDHIRINAEARVEGEITAARLTLEQGAQIRGWIQVVHKGAKFPQKQKETEAENLAPLCFTADMNALLHSPPA